MFDMQRLIPQIHKRLIQGKKTVATAESCTGGMLACMLTALPGSSVFFVLGLVVYSNRAKERLLAIPPSIIKSRGAVSKEVATLLSGSVRRLAKTDFGIGITGIAGPAGGSKAKPAGTVYIAVDSKEKNICRRFNFRGGRSRVRRAACLQALCLLKKLL